MGFLKFLKREAKKDGIDELYLPPAPPSLDGSKMDFGAPGYGDEMPELPEFPDFDEKISAPDKMPDFNLPEEKMPGKGISDFPSFPEMEEEEIPPEIPGVMHAKEPAAMPVPSIPRQIHEAEPYREEVESAESYQEEPG